MASLLSRHLLDEITYSLVPQLGGVTSDTRISSFRLCWLLNGCTPGLAPRSAPMPNGEPSESEFLHLRSIYRNICAGSTSVNAHLPTYSSMVNESHAISVVRSFDPTTRTILRTLNLDIGGRSWPDARWLEIESDAYFQQASLAALVGMLALVAAGLLPKLRELKITMPWHIKTNNESFRHIMDEIMELPNLIWVEIRRTNDRIFQSPENREGLVLDEETGLLYLGDYVWRGDALDIWRGDRKENERLWEMIMERMDREKANEEMVGRLRI